MKKLETERFYYGTNPPNMTVVPADRKPRRRTKKEICEAALPMINSYEVKPIKFSTLYRRAYRDSYGNYKYIGKAHDYTL